MPISLFIVKGASWPWSYGSWIYNYLCNQYLSPLMLWVRISIRAGCTTMCNKSLSVTCDRSVVFSRFSSTNKTDWYDIAERSIMLKIQINLHLCMFSWFIFDFFHLALHFNWTGWKIEQPTGLHKLCTTFPALVSINSWINVFLQNVQPYLYC
jgi:hypothetical protein